MLKNRFLFYCLFAVLGITAISCNKEPDLIGLDLLPAGERLNIDFTDNRSEVVWRHFFQDPLYSYVGTHEGAYYYPYGAWRPEAGSVMINNIRYMNAPSRELGRRPSLSHSLCHTARRTCCCPASWRHIACTWRGATRCRIADRSVRHWHFVSGSLDKRWSLHFRL